MRHLDDIARPGTPERELLDRIDPARLPAHVAVIMDGNGRWAKARKLPRVEGHRAGIRAVRETIETIARLEIPVVTLYAFSTENWKRPRYEVLTLMALLKEYMQKELDTFVTNNLKFRPIGRLEELDASVREALARGVEATAGCTGTVVQIALNYSGRQEITDMVREAVALAREGKLEAAEVDERWIARHLGTAGLPDPDLLIRTSGEERISNFLLWQLAYSEIYFTPVLWPDFGTRQLLEAIVDYQQRERRFGGLPVTSGDEENLFLSAGDARASS